MSFQSDLEQHQQLEKEVAIIRFLRDRPELDYTANRNLLMGYLGNAPATLDNLQKAVRFLGANLARKDAETLQHESAAKAADDLEQQRKSVTNYNNKLLNASPLELRRIIRNQRNGE